MYHLLFSLLLTLLLALPAQAETLSCRYFDVELPDGWQALTPPSENQGITTAVFVKGTGTPSVTLLVGETGGADIKTIADIFAEQYKADDPPSLKNGRYVFYFSQQKKNCQAWIAVQENIFMVTTLMGNPREGLRFMKRYVSSKSYPDLIPR